MIYLIREGYWYEDSYNTCDTQYQPCAFCTKESAKDYVMHIYDGWKKNYGKSAKIVERPDGGIEATLNIVNDKGDTTHHYCFYQMLELYK